MPDVLLVCPESIARRPAGVGIRFVELTRVLQRAGLEVVLLTPDGLGHDAGGIVHRISPEAIHEWSSRVRVAMVQGHPANDFFAHRTPVPTIVDLYDPYIVENFQYLETLGPAVFENDLRTLRQSLAEGDFFLCASNAQREFYLGAMVATGRLNSARYAEDPTCRSLIDLVPFGVPLAAPGGPDRLSGRVLFGGIYDWYDPVMAIDAVREARSRMSELTLSFTRHPNAKSTPQSKLAAAEVAAASDRFVEFAAWTPYEERLDHYRRHSVALLTFSPSLETDLAMRTRIFDYLWAGLPVISSSAPGTDEIIERYEAGVVVREQSPAAFASALTALLTDAPRYERAVKGARAWAAQHSWDDVTRPLIEFCRTPRFDAHKPSRVEVTVTAPVSGWSRRLGSLLRGRR